MKKLSYLFVAAAALTIVACGEKKAGYVINGTVEGGVDGDTVFLQESVGRQLVNIDTAIIKNGKFEFKGVQDSTVHRYLSNNGKTKDDYLATDFYLENGNIAIALAKDDMSVVSGTPSNDAYQLVYTQVSELNKHARDIYVTLNDSMSAEQREAKLFELNLMQEKIESVRKKGIEDNITNPVGIQMFKQSFYNFSTDENEALLKQIPELYKNDPAIVRIQEATDKQKLTAPGTKFINFEMPDPAGKMVRSEERRVGKE